MKSRKFRVTGIICLMIILIASAFTSYATLGDMVKDNIKKEQVPQKPENEITGKIVYIDATKVTISVAERKEPERLEGGQKMVPPDKLQDKKVDTPPEKLNDGKGNGNFPEKKNIDEMFTLTGESKTIDITRADFGNKHNRDTNGQIEATEIKKTYADYSTGDYISIEATDSTYAVAKTVRDIRGG